MSETVDPARHLTLPRRTVLQLLAAHGPLDQAGIRESWLASRPAMAQRHVRELPRMIRHLLWRLEILEWVALGERGYELTESGRRVLAPSAEPHGQPSADNEPLPDVAGGEGTARRMG